MKRVLVHRPGSIGDTVVALPAFHLIRRHFAREHISVLTNVPAHEGTASLTSVLPRRLYDSVVEYPLGRRSVAQLWGLRAAICDQRFDLVIGLTEQTGPGKSARDYLFFSACGIPAIRGLPFRRSNFVYRREAGSGLYRSEASRLLDRLRWLGTIDLSEDRWWDLELSESERDAARAALSALSAPQPMIAVSVGTKFDTNDWSHANWMRLIARLSEQFFAYSLVSIGAGSESARSQELLDLWRGETVNLCGRVPPRVSACALQQADLFIGHDSGPAHLASAVGTPCVAIYSARNPPGRWFPRGRNHTVLYNEVPCSGCELDTCETFAKKCILSISVDRVFEAISARLATWAPTVSAAVARGPTSRSLRR